MIAASLTSRPPANWKVGVSGSTSVSVALPRALSADAAEIPSARPFTDEYAFLLVSSKGDVPFPKMAGSFDAVTPSSKLPTDPRIASDPSDAAFRPHAPLAFPSALSSEMFTCNGRPSVQLRFTPSTAALVASENADVAFPSGVVSGTISVTLIGVPGHGFDGAVVPVAEFVFAPALLELLLLL